MSSQVADSRTAGQQTSVLLRWVPVVNAETLQDDPRLQRLLDVVVEDMHPIAVYLFGSRAEGRAAPDSDYDLLVVLPDNTDERSLDPITAYQSGVRADVPADAIPTTLSDFLDSRGVLCTIAGIAHDRGWLVYGQSGCG